MGYRTNFFKGSIWNPSEQVGPKLFLLKNQNPDNLFIHRVRELQRDADIRFIDERSMPIDRCGLFVRMILTNDTMPPCKPCALNMSGCHSKAADCCRTGNDDSVVKRKFPSSVACRVKRSPRWGTSYTVRESAGIALISDESANQLIRSLHWVIPTSPFAIWN